MDKYVVQLNSYHFVKNSLRLNARQRIFTKKIIFLPQ